MFRVTERNELLDVVVTDAVDPQFSVNVPLEVLAWVRAINHDSESTLLNFFLPAHHHFLDPVKAECVVTC